MQKIRISINLALTNIVWWLVRLIVKPVKANGASLLLVPCEQGSVIGSRGDEAMVYAILQSFSRRHPEGKMTVVCNNMSFAETEDGKRLKRDFPQMQLKAVWNGHIIPWRVYKAIKEIKPTEVYSLGADCMDGFYSIFESIWMLAAADIAVRMGIETRLTGFSFNDNPRKEVISAFKKASPKLVCNLRDPVSLERFEKAVGPGRLVADTAFCLEPKFSPRVNELLAEMKRDRDAGKFILGLNMNPMLKLDASKIDEALERLENVSIWLIPHDYRDGGDIDELAKLHHGRLVRDVLSAAELKALTSGLDALWTSRMHLGIAALGMGKPIGAFAYQGKFAGLFRHLRLGEQFLLSPDSVDELGPKLESFITYSKSINVDSERVRHLAQQNLIS